MTLTPGTRLGRYEVRSKIGAGGMGEVYLATDTELGRPAALKILPAEVAADADRMRRFTQEARSAAALNHPAIAHVYEIGESAGVSFIAMELIDGETLREKIHRDKTDLKRLLGWLAQVAEGLAKAHAAGIVHRDLKPDNIMVTRDGYAKILDFGLAKVVEARKPAGTADGLEEAATAMLPQLSQPGVVMGTPGYMSPEQAQGRAVDLRSDIFSFGCVLYEAATGRKPFEGESLVESLHKTVYETAAHVRDLNPSAPADLQRIVRRCLAKDPEERYQTIKDVAIELKELRREMDGEPEPYRPVVATTTQGSAHDDTTDASGARVSLPVTTAGRGLETEGIAAARQTSSAEYIAGEIKRHRGVALAALAALALVLAGVAYGVYRMTAGKPALTFQAAKLQRLTNSGKVTLASISPDGRYVVHVVDDAGQQSLWVRQVTTASNVQIVAPSKALYRGLTFSPDGDYIYFVRRDNDAPLRTLYQSPVLGGSTRKVWDDVDSPVTFSPDGKQFAFVRLDGTKGETSLLVANTDGSGERTIATRKEPSSFGFRGPAWSPDGKVIACGASRPVEGKDPNQLVEVGVEGAAEREVGSRRWGAIDQVAWTRDGGGLLMSAADASSNYSFQLWYISRADGEAQRVTNDLSNYSGVSLTADSNALLTVHREAASDLWLMPGVDAGRATRITSGKSDGYLGVAWTSDDRIVHATLDYDIWITGGDGSGAKLLSVSEHNNRYVSVSPDNRYVVFESWRTSSALAEGGGVWRTDLDGGNAKQLTSDAGANLHPQISPDGRWVVYDSNISGKNTLWKVSIDGGTPARLTDEFSSLPAFSPDGGMIACVYRRALSAFKLVLIPSGGGQPVKEFDLPPLANLQENGVRQLRWSPDGRALHFIVNSGGVSNLWSQPVDGGAPKQITDFKSDLIFAFDWSRDGKQLALSRGTVARDAVLIGNSK